MSPGYIAGRYIAEIHHRDTSPGDISPRYIAEICRRDTSPRYVAEIALDGHLYLRRRNIFYPDTVIGTEKGHELAWANPRISQARLLLYFYTWHTTLLLPRPPAESP